MDTTHELLTGIQADTDGDLFSRTLEHARRLEARGIANLVVVQGTILPGWQGDAQPHCWIEGSGFVVDVANQTVQGIGEFRFWNAATEQRTFRTDGTEFDREAERRAELARLGAIPAKRGRKRHR